MHVAVAAALVAAAAAAAASVSADAAAAGVATNEQQHQSPPLENQHSNINQVITDDKEAATCLHVLTGTCAHSQTLVGPFQITAPRPQVLQQPAVTLNMV